MNGGVALCIEVDARAHPAAARDALPRRGGRRPRRRDRAAAAAAKARAARAQRRAAAPTRPTSLPAAAARAASRPTSSPTRRAPTTRCGYVPNRHVAGGGRRGCARRTPTSTCARSRAAMAAHCAAMVGFLDARRRGLRLRQQPARRGAARRLRARLRLPRLRPRLHPAAVLRGQGPVPLGRALGRSGRHRRDRPRRARGVPRRRARCARWIRLAGERVAFQGLPARICWLGLRRARTGSGCASTRWCAAGELSAPIVIGRDHLDSGSVASPYRETEAMADGSDAIADWPLLNALVNTASGASWVSHPPRRRRRHRALDPRRHGLRRRRHRPRRARSSSGC